MEERYILVMLTIFSDLQRVHKPEYIMRAGKYAQSYDMPERIDSILSAISESDLGPVIAPDDAGLEPVRAVHDEGMIQYLATAYTQYNLNNENPTPVFPDYFPPPGQRNRPECFAGRKGFYCIDMETPIDKDTWDVATASAHCAWTGAIRLRSGESCVYALCRPPGHHAGQDFFGGYCYLNNAAIAARALGEGGERVAILDIDYHHGNGTQAIFYYDPLVWYGSLHIDPDTAYPYFAGYTDEIGSGEGQGANRNMPLPPGINQSQYISALERLLEHLMAFDTRWLVVSAGFDTYVRDPLSTFQITTSGFHEIGSRIHTLDRPTLVVQEGGYFVPDLGLNVVALLSGVLG
ncbi:histone deacetylase family protein [Candidatus Poribacteria bacterium]